MVSDQCRVGSVAQSLSAFLVVEPSYIGIMDKNMETTILELGIYWGYIK